MTPSDTGLAPFSAHTAPCRTWGKGWMDFSLASVQFVVFCFPNMSNCWLLKVKNLLVYTCKILGSRGHLRLLFCTPDDWEFSGISSLHRMTFFVFLFFCFFSSLCYLNELMAKKGILQVLISPYQMCSVQTRSKSLIAACPPLPLGDLQRND